MIEPSESPRIEPAAGTYYHSVRSASPDPADFKSQTQQGRAPRGARAQNPDYVRWFNGVSVHDTPEQTRRNAEYFDWKIGEFVAEIVIPEGTVVTYERLNEHGHGNLYNTTPEFLADCVTRIFHEGEIAKFHRQEQM